MEYLSFLFCLVIIPFNSFTQSDDTLRSITIEELNLTPYLQNCAHGHICCYAGCSCCPELKRAQVFDTISSIVTNGIQRSVVKERYEIAREHDIQPTHIRFKKNGEWSDPFYPVDISEYPIENPKHQMKVQKPYENDLLLVSDRMGECMLLDLEGNEVPMTFDVTTVFTPELSIGSIVINNSVFCALLKPDGTAISRTKYFVIHPFNNDDLAVVQSTSGWGLIDKNGNEVIPSKYNRINKIGDNRYCIENSYRNCEIFDGQGNQITKKEYSYIGNYSDGMVFARMQNNALCYLDLNGKEVLRVKEEWASDFGDGVAAVMQGGKWGFIDKTGKLVIPCQYYNVHGFQNGVAAVATGVMNNEMWILIDKTGKQINKKYYSEIMAFKNGIAQVRMNGVGYGFIDTKGNEVMECKYTDFGYGTADHWDVDGMFVRSTIQDRKVLENSLEIVDLNGKQLVSLDSYIAYRLQVKNGDPALGCYSFIVAYKSGNKCNVIDFKGNILFKSDYDNIMIYTDQLAVGVKDSEYFILNPTTGEVVSNFGSKQINNIQYGIVTVITDKNSYIYDFYDLKGNRIE